MQTKALWDIISAKGGFQHNSRRVVNGRALVGGWGVNKSQSLANPRERETAMVAFPLNQRISSQSRLLVVVIHQRVPGTAYMYM